MNLFFELFYDRWVNGAFYPVPIAHLLFWMEALSSFPTIESIPNISCVSRRTKQIQVVILHHTGSLEFNTALKWFSNPNSYSSTNYLVDRDGYILCLVPEDKAALHIPNAKYNNSRMVNELSLGVHLVGDGTTEFTDAQYEAVAMLCTVWKERYGLKNEDIKKHSEIECVGEHNDPEPWDQEKFAKLLDIFTKI
jgi:N-acetyl-anhydromuramyl-L-alanine amidase AmpD